MLLGALLALGAGEETGIELEGRGSGEDVTMVGTVLDMEEL